MENKNYNLCWGTLKVKPNDFEIEEDYEDCVHNLFELLPNCAVKEENGKYGLYDQEGIIMPCIFDQVEKIKESWFCRRDNTYCWLKYAGGRSILFDMFEPKGDIFVENGKVGWRSLERIYVPAKYEQVGAFCKNEVFWCLKDGECIYLDSNEKEVLTYVRPVDAEDEGLTLYDYLETLQSNNFVVNTSYEKLSDGTEYNAIIKYHTRDRQKIQPFDFRGKNKNSLTTLEFVGHPVESDSNVVQLLGNWIRVDRQNKKDICQLLVDPTDELALTNKDIASFTSNLATEQAAFIAHGHGEHPLQECVDQLSEMPTFCNTWYFRIKIWLASGEQLPIEELRWLRHEMDTLPSNCFGNTLYAVGHDASLEPGEVRMMAVTYFEEEYFNTPKYIDEWSDFIGLRTLDETKAAMKKFRHDIKENLPEKFQEEVWSNWTSGIIDGMEASSNRDWRAPENLHYKEYRPWEETVKVLNYFKEQGYSYKSVIAHCIKAVVSILNRDEINSKDERNCDFYYKLAMWGIDNGADINIPTGTLSKKGTVLDILNDSMTIRWEWEKEKTAKHHEIFDKFHDLLISHGAMTKEELNNIQNQNTDYETELKLLNGF